MAWTLQRGSGPATGSLPRFFTPYFDPPQRIKSSFLKNEDLSMAIFYIFILL
jgi:hypothetical protein